MRNRILAVIVLLATAAALGPGLFAVAEADMPAEPLSEIPSAMYLKKRGMK